MDEDRLKGAMLLFNGPKYWIGGTQFVLCSACGSLVVGDKAPDHYDFHIQIKALYEGR